VVVGYGAAAAGRGRKRVVTQTVIRAGIVLAVIYSIIHVIVSGIWFPLRTPNVGQIVEELQPLYRLFTVGEATVDHPRQYGPVFLALFHPVYKLNLEEFTLLSWYGYALGVLAILIAFFATLAAIRTWMEAKGATLSGMMILAFSLLWANFSPIYGVLTIKNIELWELALMAIGGAAILRGRRTLTGWSIAAASLVKMLPLVFVPYLFLRDRRTFAHTAIALAVLLTAAQAVYGTAMGWGYLPAIVRAAAGGDGYGNVVGLTWHENVSLRGVVLKSFGYLEQPERVAVNQPYTKGYYVRVAPALRPTAGRAALVVELIGGAWVVWTLWRRRHLAEPSRTFWDWALVGLMMLVLAPQISQDYMVLTLGAFSYVLAGCMLYGTRAAWIEFAIAVLLVGNILPRGLFARLVLIDPLMTWTGYTHLTRSEAYQYFCFPLLGLLVLLKCWARVSTEGAAERGVAV
jgi:hypothetical protein